MRIRQPASRKISPILHDIGSNNEDKSRYHRIFPFTVRFQDELDTYKSPLHFADIFCFLLFYGIK